MFGRFSTSRWSYIAVQFCMLALRRRKFSKLALKVTECTSIVHDAVKGLTGLSKPARTASRLSLQLPAGQAATRFIYYKIFIARPLGAFLNLLSRSLALRARGRLLSEEKPGDFEIWSRRLSVWKWLHHRRARSPSDRPLVLSFIRPTVKTISPSPLAVLVRRDRQDFNI